MSFNIQSRLFLFRQLFRIISITVFFGTHVVNANEQIDASLDFRKTTAHLEAATFKRDPEFLVSVRQVSESVLNDRGNILVDIRRPEEYESFNIPGSINLALHTVKTKIYLKHLMLVLVNNGANSFSLEEECRNLQELGFRDVKILVGGLTAWRNFDGVLIGDPVAREGVDEIEPVDFFVDRNYDDWLVLDISEGQTDDVDILSPSVIHLPYTKPQEFRANFEKTLADKKGSDSPFILIFNEDGDDYRTVKQAVRGIGVLNVFYLQGGLAGYRDFLQNHVLITKSGKKRIVGCKTCP